MKTVVWILAIVALAPVLSFAQQERGEVRGNVRDAKTGQPLAGANVVVRGTLQGATTDSTGVFTIRGIRFGPQTVVVSLIGYAREVIPNVLVGREEHRVLNVQLDPQEVESQQVVVTASRREQSTEDVPVSISTVTAKALSLRVPVTLDDALRYVPGVTMMYDQVNIRGSSGYSRGVGTRVLLLFDGLPYLTGDTGEITWETVPVFQIARIEVVKGAGSALYGSNALGGVINVITKDIPDKPQVAFRLYSGIYSNPGFSQWDWSGTSRFNSGGYVSFSDKTGPLGYLVSISRSVDDSYRENDAYHRWDFYLKTHYTLSSTQDLTLVGNLAQRTHGNFFWWKSLREATRPADSQLNGNVNSNRGNVSFAYKEFLADNLFYNVKGIYFGNFWRDDSAGHINNVSSSHSFYTEVQATFAASESNVLTAGIAANYDKVTSNLFGTHPGVGAALFAQDELSFVNHMRFTAGVRYDWQKVSILESGSQINPKLGVVYTPDEITSFRASFGTGFRYPSISELYTNVNTGVSILNIVPNPDLKAESSYSYEIGVARTLFGRVFIDWALFQNDFRDLIEPGVDTTSNPIAIRFANVTKARIRGTELDVRFNVVEKMLRGEMSYTYTDPKDLTTGQVLKFRPRHTFYGSLNFEIDHFTLEGDYRFMSRVEAIDNKLVELAPIIDGEQRVPITVADFRAFYDLADVSLPMRVGLSVTNVLNYHYVELIGNLAPVRMISLSIDGVF